DEVMAKPYRGKLWICCQLRWVYGLGPHSPRVAPPEPINSMLRAVVPQGPGGAGGSLHSGQLSPGRIGTVTPSVSRIGPVLSLMSTTPSLFVSNRMKLVPPPLYGSRMTRKFLELT